MFTSAGPLRGLPQVSREFLMLCKSSQSPANTRDAMHEVGCRRSCPRAFDVQAPLGMAVLVVSLAVVVAACSRSAPPEPTRAMARPAYDPNIGASASRRVVEQGNRIPKGGGTYKIGVPYRIAGRWYYPREEPNYDRRGIASWYGDDFHGRKTANGEIYDMYALTAAHPTLPMPSYVWVTNETNGRTLLVRVNDRGPYAHDRIIDLSRAVARALGSEGRGLADVRVRYAGPAPLDGNDAHELAILRSQPWYRSVGPGLAATQPRQLQHSPGTPAHAPARWTPTADRAPPALQLHPPVRKVAEAANAYVVAGTFRSETFAARRAAEVRRFAPAEIRPLSAGTGPAYRVRTSTMSGDAAHRLRKQLADAGILDTAVMTE